MATQQRQTKKSPLDIVERKPLKSSSVLSPEQLHSKTQRNAFNLLEREERNAKRSRLSSLLLHQFITKYGNKNPSSMVNTFIKQAVNEFIDAYVNVHDAEPHIPKLEREIKEESDRIRDSIKEARRMEASTFTKTDNNHPTSSGKHSSGKGGVSNPATERTKRLEDFSDNQWPVINALMTVTEEEQIRREKQAAASKKTQFRQVLDVQLATHRQLEEQKQAEKQKMSETMKQVKQTYEQEMEAQRIAREEKLRKEREIRLEQIEEQKQRREHERQMKIAQEKNEMARAKRLSEEEDARKLAAKERQKQAQDALLQENEYNRQIKASVMKERQEYEKRVAEEYERKLEAEEKARADAFKARMDHLANIAKGYESRVGVALQQQRQEEADKVMTALHAREKAEEERQRSEAETRRIKAKKDLDYNITMMEKRQREKEQERLAALELRLRLEKEAVDAKKQDRVAAEERRLKHLELKYNLDRQLDQLHERQRKEKAGQSDAELNINKTLLKKLEDDPQLLNKVLDRINHPQAQMTSRSAGGAGKNNKAAMQVSNIF